MAPRRRLGRLAATGVAVATAVAGTVVAITLAATPAAAAGTGTGYLRTNGNRIVDATGATVRLTGINWFGMETDNRTFHGLWANAPATWRGQIERMASLGFNTLRIPYAGDAVRPGATATSINTFTNPDLVGLSPLEILDRVIQHAGSLGMRVILDRHRPSAAGQTPLWYTPQVSEASMIADWVMLANRYANNPTVIGADLFNEPHADGTDPNGTGACWGCGVQTRDWRLAAERIGNAILQANPNWLIFVEGVSCLSGGNANEFDNIPDPWQNCDWWGGNLSAAIDQPVRLNVANRLVYAPHDYAISVFDRQSWFEDPAFPANLPAVWDHFWGKLAKQNVAPIMLGEFGSTLANPLDVQWLNTLMNYLTTNGMSFTYWSWNPNSGDTGGIALDDWYSVNQQKMNILSPHLVPPVPGNQTQPPTTTTTRPPTTTTTSRPPTTTTTSRPPTTTTTSRPPSTTTTTNPPPTGCTATYTVNNQWPGGFGATVTVRAGNTALNGWTVSWTLASGQTISTLWEGSYTPNGSAVRVSNLDYNRSVPANGTRSFGFNGTWNGSNPVPVLTCTSP
jgi:endoglucanase